MLRLENTRSKTCSMYSEGTTSARFSSNDASAARVMKGRIGLSSNQFIGSSFASVGGSIAAVRRSQYDAAGPPPRRRKQDDSWTMNALPKDIDPGEQKSAGADVGRGGAAAAAEA